MSKKLHHLDKLFITFVVVSLPVFIYFFWPAKTNTQAMTEKEEADELILPVPLHVELNQAKVALGERLFMDTGLSKDGTISCHTCHNLKQGGDDNRSFSKGINGKLGNINAPTVFNSSLNFKQFWNGRANTLEEQAAGPITNPIEMGNSWDEVLKYLNNDKEYSDAFYEIYNSEITPELVTNAIAEFERSLLTPNSRFDQFLRGDTNAISSAEKKGYELFEEYGCISCHQGVGVGGNMFQEFGVMGGFSKDKRKPTKADLGRFAVTEDEEDKFVFKVPSLRNVELTAPYFHDGSVETLSDAVTTMAQVQLGMQLPNEDVKYLVAFLKTLTGKYKGEKLKN